MTPAELVSEFIHALERSDLDSALAMVSEDCEYDNVPMGAVHGPGAIRAALGTFLGGCSEIEWIVHHEVSSGDLGDGLVMNERLDRFRIGERWLELPVAGLFTIRDGRITLWRDYFDQATFTSQLS